MMNWHELALSVVSTGALAKFALMAIRTMPPPPEKCGFVCRWFYDFCQAAGDNPDKLGQSRKTE